MEYVLRSTPGNVQWGLWDGRSAPVLRIASGDRVTIETLSGEPDDLPDPSLGFDVVPGHAEVLASTFRGPGPHLLTGPVHVEGAEPGDVLEVRVLDITLRCNWGWNLQVPTLGTLPEDFPEFRRIHIPLDRAHKVARLPWGQELPLAPFFGNFGVAPPAGWGRLSSKEPRAFGGNMDNKELKVGTTLYLPVFNEGGGFYAGDGHGVQGDGEVCITALETGLTGTFRLTVRKDLQGAWPFAETPTDLMSIGLHESLDEAMRQAVREMVRLVCVRTSLTRNQAYMLCSLAGNLRITQTVDGNKGVHMMMPKTALAGK